MGLGNSKNGLNNTIIGNELIANSALPNNSDPRWQKAGKIQNLYIYPVKSLHALSVKSANIEKHGLRFGDCQDRQFAILDGKNKICDSMRYSKLVMIKSEVKGDTLILSAPETESIEVNSFYFFLKI